MSTVFTALEVGKGDAFLLQTPGWNCLFDAGQYSNIIRLLQEKGIDNLNLAICSHNDVDHAKGFIELLLDGSITIDEIWLPSTFANVIQFVKDNNIQYEEIEYLARYRYPKENDCQKDNQDEGRYYSKNENKQADIESLLHNNDCSAIPVEKLIDDNLIKSYDNYLYWINYYRSNHRSVPQIVLSLDRIMSIAILAFNRRCRIRWFEPTIGCACNSIDYGFVALNCREISRLKKIMHLHAFARAVQLTVVNHYSLVFEYQKDNVPIIRFSADSDCECGNSPYKNSIIITAPHHGSEANANVYKAFENENVIWVRSDCKSQSRPCYEFKSMKTRYCLACKRKTHDFKEEICFEYIGNHWWHIKGNRCLHKNMSIFC